MKTLKVLLIACGLVLIPAQQASAGDYEVQNVMDDVMYGAGIGAMVGLGVMLLSKQPTDNWDFITKGLGIGIIAGAAYGVYRSSASFATLENGEFNFGVPMPQLALRETPSGLDIGVQASLIGGSF